MEAWFQRVIKTRIQSGLHELTDDQSDTLFAIRHSNPELFIEAVGGKMENFNFEEMMQVLGNMFSAKISVRKEKNSDNSGKKGGNQTQALQ